MHRYLLAISFFICFLCNAQANNLSIDNGETSGSSVTFHISWDNSWNLSNEGGNHDAVWLFLKGKNSSGIWIHLQISTNESLHNAHYPLAIETVSDGKGVFIKKLEFGILHIPPTSITLSLDTDISNFSEIRVFGVEMVHIPQGQYYLGDGASISSLGNVDGNAILINSENEITGSELTIVNPNSQFAPQQLPSSIPQVFPKGFKPFYVMKYEISQIQYVDFLNTLTYSQQQSRTAYAPSSLVGTYAMVNPNQPDSLYRNGIVIKQSGSSTGIPAIYAMDYNANGVYSDDTDGIHRAANFLNWADLSAYLDWAALRPMTEMEFEKICRGTNVNPVTGEFAWGSSLVTNANNTINDGTFFEAVSDVPSSGSGLSNHGNFVFTEGWGLRGVLRTGFAAEENTTRLEAGASYYGVMELSGNVWEQTIMLAGGGETFQGNTGDGQLAENGDANQPFWCNPSSAEGVLLKGGGWASTISNVGSWRDLAVSDRFYSHIKPSTRRNSVGGRGAR